MLVDAIVALGLFGLLAVTLAIGSTKPGLDATALWTLAWGTLLTLPLSARRAAPVTVLGLVTVGMVGFQAIQPLSLVVPMAALALAIYTVGIHARPGARDLARIGSGLTLLALLGSLYVTLDVPTAVWPPRAGLVVVLFVAAWSLGDQVRNSSERERELAQRTAELRSERERNVRRAAAEERLRIAHELHDVLAHHVSMMGVQAAGARRVLARDPDRATSALETIESSSREAMSEMQCVLRLLRDGSDDRRVRRLADLDEIIDEIRRAGVRVRVSVGSLPELPAGVDLVATRIVQESLTNVLRHAGPGTFVSVRIDVRDDELRVVVHDDGRGEPAFGRVGTHGGTGFGLVGLRERVGVHGGRFEAGPQPDGSFRVAARLPLARPDG